LLVEVSLILVFPVLINYNNNIGMLAPGGTGYYANGFTENELGVASFLIGAKASIATGRHYKMLFIYSDNQNNTHVTSSMEAQTFEIPGTVILFRDRFSDRLTMDSIDRESWIQVKSRDISLHRRASGGI